MSASSSVSSSSSEDAPVIVRKPPPSSSSAGKKAVLKTSKFDFLDQVRAGNVELMLIKVPSGFDARKLDGVTTRVGSSRELVQLPGTDIGLFGMESGMYDRVALIPCGENGFEGKALEFSSAVSVVTAVETPDRTQNQDGVLEALKAIAPKTRPKIKPRERSSKLPAGANAPKVVARSKRVRSEKESKKKEIESKKDKKKSKKKKSDKQN
jgi:hypothetical protein